MKTGIRTQTSPAQIQVPNRICEPYINESVSHFQHLLFDLDYEYVDLASIVVLLNVHGLVGPELNVRDQQIVNYALNCLLKLK